MVFWVFLALMTGAAVMTVLWPLSRDSSLQPAAQADVTFYRDQIAEIARDEERGVISSTEAAGARIESGRRLLRAAESAPRAGTSMGEPCLRRRRAAAALALSIVPLVGLALYGALGSPYLPGLPLASRVTADPSTLDVTAALARIETHLAQAPDDRRGWELVAPIYLRVGRFDDAAKAYSAAIRLGAAGEDELTGYGEALVAASNGVVSADAKDAFARAAQANPGSAKARFYLALAAEQDGELGQARDGYAAIVASAAPDAPYLQVVRARLARLDGSPAPASPSPAARQMPPEILAMVDGLDQRLKEGGGSEAEWTRLIRSLSVLGRTDDARDRVARARTALAGDAAAIANIDSQAKELGLSDPAGPRTAETIP